MIHTGAFSRIDRWFGLSAAMIMMGCAGLTYTYAVYSEEMKRQLHYSQEQVDDIGAAKDFGGVVGLFSGILYSLYPSWVTVLIGALLHLFGYSMFWGTLAGKVTPSFWLLCVYAAVGNGGDGWIDTACMMTSLQNFEDHRGTAMGILKAQLGLSGAIFVMIYEALLEPDVDAFLLLMSLAPTLVALSLACFIRPFHQTSDENKSPAVRFKFTCITIVILGFYMMLSMSWDDFFQVTKPFKRMNLSITLLIMLVMYSIPLFGVPSFLHKRVEKSASPAEGIDLVRIERKASGLAVSDEEESKLLSSGEDDLKEPVHHSVHHHFHAMTVRDSVADFNFWLIFLVVTVGAGAGVSIINNFAQIGKALRAQGTDLYVGVISIWSCFGRLFSGYGSDYLMRLGYPRTLCLFITQLTMAFCCLLLATGLLPSLFLGSALTGLSYGAYWTLVPAILSDVFGVQNFTVLYKLVSLGPPVSSYLLSAKLMGFLYDEEAELYHRHNTAVETNSCYGPKCFGFGLLALAVVSLVGASASFFLLLGTKTVYQKTKPGPV